MLKTIASYFVIFVLLFSKVLGQKNFEKIYYLGDMSNGHCIIETSDHNFLFSTGGHTLSKDHSYFVKIDQNGNIMWANDYFNYQLANGNWVAETKSGKYILMSEESYYDPLAVVMRQSDTKGVLDWTLKYPEQHSYSAPSYYFFPRHFSETKDGGFIVTGGKSAGISDTCFIMSVSKTGVLNWYKNVLDTMVLEGEYVLQTADSGFVLLANYFNHSVAPTQSQLIKLSNNGTVIWNKKLVNFVGNTIIIDSNNNFLVGGTSYVSGKQTPTLLKYSDSGDSLWRVNHSNSTNRNMLSCSIIMHNKNLFSTAVQSEKGNTTGYYLSLVLHTDSLLNILSIDTVNITKGKRVAIWDLMISKNSCNGYCLIGSVLDSAGAWGPRTFVKLSYNNIAEQRDVTTNPLMSKICIGDTVTLSSLWGIGNFSWSPSVGLSSATDSIVKAFPIVTTTYIVTSEVNGCIKTGAVKVAVVDIPQLSINVSKEILCKDHTGSATVMVTKGIGLYNYSWITGVNTDNTNPQYTIDNLSSGTYTVKVTDGNNCIGSGTITLIEPEAISNTLTIKDASCDGKNGNAVINTIGGTGVYTYSWSPFGSTSFEPRISNIGSGTYTLTIFDANGCTKTDTFEIKDNSNCLCNDEIFIPNIFSPNGDGKNDVLKIEGTGISNIYFAIYNRWGNLVYETYDQARGWDGTQRGNPCESGTYVYYLKGTCVKTNSEVNLKGNVSLIR